MKVLDLFSGIGGFSLGLERAGFETVAFCEIEPFCQKILKKHWPEVPIYDDVTKLDGKQFRESVDVVCGGFPCQDLSICGKQEGFNGERSSLYTEMLRIISECEPKYAIFENVTNLLLGESGRWMAKFLYDLAQIGFDAEWHCMEAAYIGATHRRDRVWIIAYPALEHDRACDQISVGRQEQESREGASRNEVLTNAISKHEQGGSKIAHYLKQQTEYRRNDPNFRGRFDITEPALRRADDGLHRRLDKARLAAIGNAVVPQIPELIGLAIMQAEAAA